MIPINKVKELISKHEIIEKELSSGEVDKKSFADKSKEYSNLNEIIEDKGIKVFIDPGAVMYLLGTEMDYKKDEFSSTFVFKNPNETERCGCGESFKI